MMAAAFRTSLRLTLRSPWFWVASMLPLPILWIFTWRGDGAGHLLSLYHQALVFPIFFLGQMLATVGDAQRERSARADELLESLPYRPVPLLAGRLGAVCLLWVASGTVLYAVGICRAVLLRGLPVEWILLWDWFLLVPVTLVLTTGVAFAIGRRMNQGFGAYVVTLICFLLPTAPFNQALSQMFREVLGAGPTTIVDFTLSSYFHPSVGPFYPEGIPLLFNRIFAVTMGGGAVLWVVRTAARRRGDPAVRRIGLALTGTLLVAALALTGNRAVWAMRTAVMAAEEAAIDVARPAMTAGQQAPAVSGFDVALTFDPPYGGLSGKAVLTLQAPGETATFTLNRNFQVSRVLGPDGQDHPFTRSGDLVFVQTGGQGGPYTFQYRGWVSQWRPDTWGGLRQAAHIAPGSVMLPTSLAWYPLPGVHVLGYRGQFPGVADAAVSHAPAPFRLAAEGLGELHLMTNAQGERPVSAAWLIASHWKPRLVEEGAPARLLAEMTAQIRPPITVAVSPGNLQSAELMVAAYTRELAFYHRLVPLDHPLWVVEVPDSLWVARLYYPAVGYPGAMLLPAGELARRDVMVISTHLPAWWWGDARTEEEEQIHEVLTRFMADLGQRVERGRPAAYLLMRSRNGVETPMGQQTLKELDRLASEEGIDTVSMVLRSLHRTPEPLTWQQVKAALTRR